MTDDDPFAEPPEDQDRTVIRPTPGRRRGPAQPQGGQGGGAPRPAPPGRGRPPPQGQPQPPQRMPAGLPTEVTFTGINPLVSAASSLLALAVRLRNRAQHRNVDALRERVVREIKGFEKRALAGGASPQSIRAARYALCATVDDLVLQTPWGQQSHWREQSMVNVFYNEAWGGERFYEILRQLGRSPGQNLEVLELMYLCMTLGFEGQYRVMERGMAKHGQIREDLYRMIRRQRGEFERDLSPHWRGVETGHRPLASYVPLWVLAAGVAVLLTLTYMGFSYALSGHAAVPVAELNGLPPRGAVELAREAPPPPEPDPEPATVEVEQPEPGGPDTVALADALRGENVTVLEDPQTLTVRLQGAALFASASTEIGQQYLPTLERVARVLNDAPGDIIVTGHTDNIPIRTARFPSNWHLSQARAQAVLDYMSRFMDDPARMTAEGRSDNEPLVSNDTPEGRAQNRRIEIILLK
jgi:type VI secretion system protein ImpK